MKDKKYFRFFWPLAIGYGIFYASISGMLVYRDENFSSLYGITSVPSIMMITYGPMGDVPTTSIYITQHFGVLIIPVNLLIAIAVAALIGFNAVFSIYAFTNRPKKYVNNVNAKKATFLGAIGVTTSLFAAIPINNLLRI
jgi:hypothetical protein